MRGLLLIAGVLATSQPAWAKYDPCGYASVLEPDGRAPRNAKIWTWHGGADWLRVRGPGVDRAISPSFAGSRDGLGAFDPGLLERDGIYRIVDVWDPGGQHAWTLGELAAGSELDLVPPRTPGFHALAITQLVDPREPLELDGSSGSGGFDGFGGFDVPASDIATALDLSGDTIALDVTFDDSPDHHIMPPEDPGMLGRNRCVPGRGFRVGARICMSIRAIDVAGNRSDPATRCTTVGGRIGETRREAYRYAWPARRERPSDGPAGKLALAALAGFLGWWLASRRFPTAHLLT